MFHAFDAVEMEIETISDIEKVVFNLTLIKF